MGPRIPAGLPRLPLPGLAETDVEAFATVFKKDPMAGSAQPRMRRGIASRGLDEPRARVAPGFDSRSSLGRADPLKRHCPCKLSERRNRGAPAKSE